MKKLLQVLSLSLLVSFNAYALESNEVDQEISQIQKDWAISKYKSKDNDQRIAGYRQCAQKSQNLAKKYPDSAKALIWQGICLSSEAELTKLTALGKVKEAKELFDIDVEKEVEAQDTNEQ